MVVNRYTKLSPSRFNPLSMQEIFTVPLVKQKQHDEIQAQLDELGLFDINRLSQDDEIAKEYIDNYRKQIDSQTENIFKSGVNNRTSREVRKLMSDRNKWLSNDGEGGKIQGNYNAYQNYKTQLDDLLKDGKIGNNRYNALLNQATAKYQGVRSDGQLNLEAAANRVDVGDKLRTYAKDIMSNPTVLETNTDFKYDSNSGFYINTQTKQKATQKDLINQALQNMALTDPEIMNYLNQRERLGLGSAKTILDGITKTLDAGYSVDETEQNLQARNPFESKGTDKDKNNKFDNPSYEEFPQQTYALPVNTLKNMTSKMVDYEVSSTGYTSPTTGISAGGGSYIVEVDDNKREKIYESLPEKDKNIYDKIYSSLNKKGVIQSDNKYSEESVKAINNYIENNKKYTESVKLITNGQNSEYNGNSVISSKTLNEVSNAWYSQRVNRSYMINGELKSWDQLDSSTQELLNDPKTKVNGYLSPKNFTRLNYNGAQNSDALASMISVVTPDGQQIMVTRGRSEINSPAYKSDMKFNEIWSNTNMMPGIEYSTELNGEKFNVVKLTPEDKNYQSMKNKAIEEYVTDLVTNHNIDPQEALNIANNSFFNNKGAIYSILSKEEEKPTVVLEDHLLSAIRGTNVIQ